MKSAADSPGRSHFQSPKDASTRTIANKDLPPLSTMLPTVTATATSTLSSALETSKATTDTDRRTSLSDLEKELQEFDIDPDKDDVSDIEKGQSTGFNKKFADEDEEVME